MIKEGVFFGSSTLYLYIKDHKNMTATAHLIALRCCTGSKLPLILISAVKFWIPARMLKLLKRSMKTSLTWDHPWIIYTTDLILKLSASIISLSWKRSWNTLIIVRISMARQSHNIIIICKMPTVINKGREEL